MYLRFRARRNLQIGPKQHDYRFFSEDMLFDKVFTRSCSNFEIDSSSTFTIYENSFLEISTTLIRSKVYNNVAKETRSTVRLLTFLSSSGNDVSSFHLRLRSRETILTINADLYHIPVSALPVSSSHEVC